MLASPCRCKTTYRFFTDQGKFGTACETENVRAHCTGYAVWKPETMNLLLSSLTLIITSPRWRKTTNVTKFWGPVPVLQLSEWNVEPSSALLLICTEFHLNRRILSSLRGEKFCEFDITLNFFGLLIRTKFDTWERTQGLLFCNATLI